MSGNVSVCYHFWQYHKVRGETISTGLQIDMRDVVGAIGADAPLVHLVQPDFRG